MQFHGDQATEGAKRFLHELKDRIENRDVRVLSELKENRFTHLASLDPPQVPKPEAALRALQHMQSPGQAPMRQDDSVMLLYKELYLRHVFSAKKPDEITIEDRVASWNNYKTIFDTVLNAPGPEQVPFDLPNGWLYDMTDEFIYQLAQYCRYRAERRGARDSPEEREKIAEIKQHPDIWEPVTVIYYLERLVTFADIQHVLEQIKEGKMSAAQVLAAGPMHVSRALGYFAMVGLLRLHTLFGDYHGAMRSVEYIDFTPEGEGEKIYKKVQACHITILFNAGFCYMMMERYYDAVRILLQALRARSLENVSVQNQTVQNINKARDNCAKLLAISLELAGRRLQMMGDDTLVAAMSGRVKADEREMLSQGTQDSLATFKSLFMQACPRFILPSAALDLDMFSEQGKNEALMLQLNIFLRQVRKQQRLPVIRSYLKLYSTISLEKLTRTAQQTETDVAEQMKTLHRELMCLKHKSRQLSWQNSGAPLDGQYKCLCDVDFYIDGDTVHIDSDFRRPVANASYFVSHIESLNELTKGISPHDIFKKRL
eukprot:TRINITY_DN17587_c0_g1_i1.p1 TRINITY_DN17587_c0_g1~~TRINITY_DN17587_c0_g1_i1.p1  ORF type:complete len:544 (+),score=270.66 TRINITY_DN17587_c0_g1_i1:94-1725(+)